MLKIAIGITGCRENLCLDDGIKEPDHAKKQRFNMTVTCGKWSSKSIKWQPC